MIHITFERILETIHSQPSIYNPDGSVLLASVTLEHPQETRLHLKLNLDVGYLDEDICSNKRLDFVTELRNPYDDKNKAVRINYSYLIEELLTYIHSGEDMLVYMHSTIESLCGLYYLCSLCKNNDIYIKDDNHMYKLDEKTKLQFADNWKQLVFENKVLRVIENDTLISVDETYYDETIKSLLKDRIIKVRDFGILARQYKLPDVWVIARIRHFIENGEIEVVEDHHIILEKKIKLISS